MLCAGDASVGELPAEERASLAVACGHFVDRANAADGIGQPEFVVLLADGCLNAELSVAHAEGKERVAAIAFLARLRSLYDVTSELNTTRHFRRNSRQLTSAAEGDPGTGAGTSHVSPIGEYLIAHRLGLFAAYNAWLDTGPRMALASRKER